MVLISLVGGCEKHGFMNHLLRDADLVNPRSPINGLISFQLTSPGCFSECIGDCGRRRVDTQSSVMGIVDVCIEG